MHTPALGYRAVSIAIATSLLAAPLILSDAMPAVAQAGAGDIPAIEIPVRNVRRYTMPRGGVVTAADVERELAASALRERRRPRPAYSAEVARLKTLPAPRNVPTRYAPEAQPRLASGPRVFVRCNVDIAPTAQDDTTFAVGPDEFLIVTHTTLTRMSLGCTDRTDVPLKSFYGSPPDAFLFEPRIVYNHATGRFVVAAKQHDFTSGDLVPSIVVAVSADSSALDWTMSEIPLDLCLRDPENFTRNLMLANAGETRIVMTLAEDSSSSDEVTGINVSAVPNGTKPAACTPTTEPLVMPVPDLTAEEILAYHFFNFPEPRARGAATRIQRYELTIGSRPSRDRLRRKTPITIPAWKPPPDARQPNGQKLDTGDGSFTSTPVRIGNRIWAVHTVNDGGFARPRVYELSATADTPLAVYQLSSVPEQNDDLFNASIAVNGAGPGGVAFVNATRTIRTGGRAGRPAMVVLAGPHASATGWQSVVVKTSPGQFSVDRFGDSCNEGFLGACRWDGPSAIQIDPLNKRRVWSINKLTMKGNVSELSWSIMIGGVRR